MIFFVSQLLTRNIKQHFRCVFGCIKFEAHCLHNDLNENIYIDFDHLIFIIIIS